MSLAPLSSRLLTFLQNVDLSQQTSKRRESEQCEAPKCDRGGLFCVLACGSRPAGKDTEKDTPITLWSLTLLTLTRFPRFQNWRFRYEGSHFCGKVSKRLESGGNDMPEVCEGCTPQTKVKLLAKRGAFLCE